MNEKQSYIVKADIRRVLSKNRKLLFVCYTVLIALIICLGFLFGSHTSHFEASKTINGVPYPAHDVFFLNWFNLNGAKFGESWIEFEVLWDYHAELGFDFPAFLIVTIVLLALLIGPFVASAIYKWQCKITELQVTESQVVGSYNSFIFKKSLQMPIEKVDNLTVISGLLDKFRTGKTLGVCSASGVIKLHFVQNAEEVVSATMKRVEELKQNGRVETLGSSPSSTTPTVTASTSEKIKELLSLKESGLISEEEFEKKRTELIEKM